MPRTPSKSEDRFDNQRALADWPVVEQSKLSESLNCVVKQRTAHKAMIFIVFIMMP